MGESVQDPVTTETVALHGQELNYLDAGTGPAILFVHGLLGSYRHWVHLVDRLTSAGYRVLAPDLFGHGGSAKPMGDYSLGAHAATLRDLLDHLQLERVTLVGHSLGGGIAMQFWYLFPERVQRLALVSSGGLGRQVSPLLRAAVLPGSEWVLPVIASRWLTTKVDIAGRALSRIGWRARPQLDEAWRGFVSLGDADSRRAFLASTRCVIDIGGQTVSARDFLPTATSVPTLLVWGSRDRIVPVGHGVEAARLIEGSRLELFENAGHFPHLDEPDRFAALLREFITD
ncbi:MAG TPA: alpha/beta fold hydrolase [Jatrophihabitans sp.]|jgi:pimeloyl-ACP methyl ester carboxylesterase|nr:alpha/beta fold hydrolase [Jatrophihabitans sp.]